MKTVLNILLGIFLPMAITAWVILFFRAVSALPIHTDLGGVTAGITVISFVILAIKGVGYDE